MHVLITRAQDEAGELAKRVVAMGHEAVVAPLLAIRFFDGPDIALDGIQAILASSANGVRALARRTQRRDVPLFAVGPQTAEAAQAANFTRVRCADGDAMALANAAAQWASPAQGPLLHATGADMEGRLGPSLEEKGFSVRTVALYEAVGAGQLPKQAADALLAGDLGAALFFSPRSARIFRDCITRAGLDSHCARVIAVAISSATAAQLAPLAFGEIRVSSAPNQEELLKCLG